MALNEGNRSNQLSFADRKDRLLLVATLLGTTTLFFTLIVKILNAISSTVFLDGFPFSLVQITVPALITSGLFIFWSSVQYIYFEYYSFAQYDDENEESSIIQSANDKYKEFLNITKLSMSMILVSNIVLTIILNTELLYTVLFMLLCVIVLLGIAWLSGKLDETYVKESGIKAKSLFSLKLFLWIFIYLITASLVGLLIINSVQGKGDISATFSTQEGYSAQMTFTNRLPEKVEINILSESNNKKSVITIMDEEFETAYINTISHQKASGPSEIINNILGRENTREEYRGAQSKYTYKKNIDLMKYVTSGTNSIEISFRFGSGRISTTHVLFNQLINENGKGKFVEKELKLKL